VTRRKDRTYRGTFVTTDGTLIGLDFYAENRALALDHALHVASDLLTHREVGPLKLASVRPVDADDFRAGDAGSWFPLLDPEVVS
jgi:hypothetical protein